MSRELVTSRGSAPSEESDTIHCVDKIFDDVLLVITFVDPSYKTIPQLERLYRKHFPKILYCGPSEPSEELGHDVIVVPMHHGVLAYECLGRAIRTYPSYKGYLFIRDDLYLNYWKIAGLNRTKIWESTKLQSGNQAMFAQTRESWIWWFTPWGLKACERAYKELIFMNGAYKREAIDKGHKGAVPWDVENSLNALLWNGKGTYKCYRGYSKLFYIPASYATAFEQMSLVFQKNQVYMEIAVPTMIRMLELKEKDISITGVDITSLYGEQRAMTDPSLFWRHYDSQAVFVRPLILKSSSEADTSDSGPLDIMLSRLDRKPDCIEIDTGQV